MRDHLLPYAFGILHATILLWALVATLHATGGTRALANIGTAPGIALGLWLVLVSIAATTWALRGAILATPTRREIVDRAGPAGIAAGAAFIIGAILGTQLWTRTFEPAILVIAVFAGFFAGAFGALLALLLAATDAALLAGARWVVARARTNERANE